MYKYIQFVILFVNIFVLRLNKCIDQDQSPMFLTSLDFERHVLARHANTYTVHIIIMKCYF